MGELSGWLTGHLDLVIVMFLALVVSVLALFSFERAVWRLYLKLQVRRRWFPEGRFVLLCWPDDPRWNGWVRESLLPRIGDSVVTRTRDGGSPEGPHSHLADRLIKTYIGHMCGRPVALVFMPYFALERVDFGDALDLLPEGGYLLKKTEDRLVELVDSQRENMRLYI